MANALTHVLTSLTAPVRAQEKHIRYMNFLVKGKVTGIVEGGALGLPILNPGHTAETLPFASQVNESRVFPSEGGPEEELSTRIADAFPAIPSASFDAFRLIIGGAERYTRGVAVAIKAFYQSADRTLQPSSIAFTMEQAPVIMYVLSLRRQAGKLFLSPVSVTDGLTLQVMDAIFPDVQGTFIDMQVQGVSFSDPFFASELAEFDFFKGSKDNGCYHRSR